MSNTITDVLPAMSWIRGYRRSWLRADLVGGVTAAAVVVPQAMAYATIAEMPVQVGLYTCMVPMFVYAVMGGSRAMSVSTTSTIATLTATTLVAAGVAAGSIEDLTTLTFLAGMVLLLARILHLGSLVENISDATTVGLKVGVGLVVAASQLPKLLGIPADPDADTFFAELRGVYRQLDEISWTTVTFSVGTIVGLLVLKRVAPKVPGALIAVVAGIVLVAVASLDDHGLTLIAHVPEGLPTPSLPAFDHIPALLPGAVAIGLMAFLESVSVARQLRKPDEPPISNDQELVANAAAAIGGAFFKALPPAGGFSQSAVNEGAGSKTQLAEIVTVVGAVLVALFLGGILSDLPEATLGAMVFVAVIGLISPKEVLRFWRFSKVEFSVLATTAVAGLVWGLLAAVAVGVLLTLVLLLHELNRADLDELRFAPNGSLRPTQPGDTAVPGLLILRSRGPLYTANARTHQRHIIERVDAADPIPQVVLLDGTAVGGLTLTIAGVLRDLDEQLQQRGIEMWSAALTDDTLRPPASYRRSTRGRRPAASTPPAGTPSTASGPGTNPQSEKTVDQSSFMSMTDQPDDATSARAASAPWSRRIRGRHRCVAPASAAPDRRRTRRSGASHGPRSSCPPPSAAAVRSGSRCGSASSGHRRRTPSRLVQHVGSSARSW